MLRLKIPETEFYDSENEEFFTVKEQTISLEHSLVSVSKWESKFKKSFLSVGPSNMMEQIEYIKCMTITQNVNPLVYKCLTSEAIKQVTEYIDDPMSATTFSNNEKAPKKHKEIITAEIIYYWMVSFGIEKAYEKWHLNRLITLINICAIKNNTEQKKMSKSELAARNSALNKARKQQLKTKG